MWKKKKPVKSKDYLAALDIGSTKINCVIASHAKDKTAPGLHILGVGQHVSKGMKNGFIANVATLEDDILNAVHSAEQQAGIRLEEVLVSLPANSLFSQVVHNTIPINQQAVANYHLRALVENGSLALKNHRLIHALPLEYYVDSNRHIKDPRGLHGENLGIRLHVVHASQSLLLNLLRCIGRCHLDVIGFVASPYASGLAALVEDELQLGVTLIELGGGSTSIASFIDGNLVHLGHVPLGGAHITQDIARGLSTPLAQAERLKTLYGSIFSNNDERENILVPLLGEAQSTTINQIPKVFLTHIIRARIEEIFHMLNITLKDNPLTHLTLQRIVLIGGGSQLAGIREFVSSWSGKPVRIGTPLGLSQGIKGTQEVINNPTLATSIGLLMYTYQESLNETAALMNQKKNTFQNIYQWMRDNF